MAKMIGGKNTMSKLYSYSSEIERASCIDYIKWEALKGKTILLSGATGMIGCCLIDIIEKRNEKFNDNIKTKFCQEKKIKLPKSVLL